MNRQQICRLHRSVCDPHSQLKLNSKSKSTSISISAPVSASTSISVSVSASRFRLLLWLLLLHWRYLPPFASASATASVSVSAFQQRFKVDKCFCVGTYDMIIAWQLTVCGFHRLVMQLPLWVCAWGSQYRNIDWYLMYFVEKTE